MPCDRNAAALQGSSANGIPLGRILVPAPTSRVTQRSVHDVLRTLEEAEPEEQWTALCFLAGREVELDAAETYGALRRAELLLAAGGDPRRRLELHGRAVSAVAHDVDTPERREQLAAGLAALEPGVADLQAASDALRILRADPDLAWQCYAAALLAGELGGDE